MPIGQKSTVHSGLTKICGANIKVNMCNECGKRNARYIDTCQQCGSKNLRQEQSTCQRYATVTGRCYLHGGNSNKFLTLFISRRWKTKDGGVLRTKYLPESFKAQFMDALMNRQLFDLREDLAMVESMILSRCESLENYHDPELWIRASKIVEDGIERDGNISPEDFINLRNILSKTCSAIDAEKEIIHLLNERRKIIATQIQKSAQEQNTLTAAQAAIMVKAMIASINQHVPEDHVRQRIGEDFASLLSGAGIRITNNGGNFDDPALDSSSRELASERSIYIDC